ncbi:MAG: biosynthetic-type acetolactate synthase large subunit [Kiritimatiellae bacterium]|nr:biosynthetic-type acetolactate synthase large subunit [Kiritimatiellia bacterium]
MKTGSKKRSGAQCVIDGLLEAGCNTLFGYPGGAVIDIFDRLYDAPLHFILSRHEQGACHMADGYARATGKPGCCLVTSGPGATNTVTALATANMDGIPLVCITGQVAMDSIGNDAFQEADVLGMTRPITKYNFLVRDVDELPAIIKKAFYIATTGKPGPVVIDIPKNIQQALTDQETPADVKFRSYMPETRTVDDTVIERLADLINSSESPLLYVGGGVISGSASDEVRALAHRANIPVCETLMGLGAFPADDPLDLRMIGMHGTVASNQALAHCDLLLAMGSRFDDRVTGKVSEFAPHAKIVHVDIDCSSIGKSITPYLGMCADVKNVLSRVLPLVKPADHASWMERVVQWKTRFPYMYRKQSEALMPQFVIEQIHRLTKGDAILVTDVGQNQMWSAQYYPCSRPRQFLTSGGLGTMGYSLPAAIGAQLGCPDKRVVSVMGDGGAQMNFQELVVAVEHKLPIVFVILNNTYLGNVRQWQELFYHNRCMGVTLSQHGRNPNERIEDRPIYLPDFVKLAEAHGAQSCRVATETEVATSLEKALASNQTWLIECLVEPTANVCPMIPPGQPVHAMINFN